MASTDPPPIESDKNHFFSSLPLVKFFIMKIPKRRVIHYLLQYGDINYIQLYYQKHQSRIIYSNLHGGDKKLVNQDNDTLQIIFGKFGKLNWLLWLVRIGVF